LIKPSKNWGSPGGYLLDEFRKKIKAME